MKKFIFALVLSIFVLVPTAVADCYVTLSYKDVAMPFAKLRLPSEMYVAQIDYQSFIDRMEKDDVFIHVLDSIKDEEEKKQYLQAMKLLFSEDTKKLMKTVKLYQLGLFANNSYNSALVVSVAGNKDFTDFNKQFLANKEQPLPLAYKMAFEKLFLTILKDKSFLLADEFNFFNKKGNEIHFLEWGVFEQKELKNRKLYTNQLRFAGTVDGTLTAGCLKFYCTYDKKNASALLLVSLDNERELWLKIFDNAILNGIK